MDDLRQLRDRRLSDVSDLLSVLTCGSESSDCYAGWRYTLRLPGNRPTRRHAMESVLVTDTSKGIGSETALLFARAGYKVHATMRNPAGAQSLAAVAAKENLPITVTALDVDKDASVANDIAAIQAEHGPVDVLVNDAFSRSEGGPLKQKGA
jgi:hypothetical protein